MNRTISVADGRDLDTGAVTVANLVPAGARSITANVGITDTTGRGFLAVNPGGDLTVKAATINWFGPDQILNNGVNLTLNDNREITIICGGFGTTDVIVDVTGYTL